MRTKQFFLLLHHFYQVILESESVILYFYNKRCIILDLYYTLLDITVVIQKYCLYDDIKDYRPATLKEDWAILEPEQTRSEIYKIVEVMSVP